MEKVLIIDGNSILNRAFYGIRLLTNQEGLYTNAIYGMVTIISKHLETLQPDYCAVAFDVKAPTFRHQLYDGYKANRKGMPDELAVQLPYAKECMQKMGLRVVTCEGYEADDILGTLATHMGGEGKQVYVLTGDRDSLQLIDEHISVLLVKTKETLEMTPKEFRDQYGIEPSVFVEVKALMGDSSDNIPGVAGIGEKTALKLIAEYGSVNALYEGLEHAALSEGMKSKLLAGKDMAILSRTLSEICRTAPIHTEADEYRYQGPNVSALRELFIRLNFTALLKKLDGKQEESVKAPPLENDRIEYQAVEHWSELQGSPLFLDWTEECVSFFDGVRFYQSQGAPSREAWQALLRDRAIVCHDFKRIYKKLKQAQIQPPVCEFDCMLAAYVLDSGRSNYSLPELYIRYMEQEIPSDNSLAISIFVLYQALTERIKQGGFEDLLFKIEIPLASVLAEMELRGFRVDCSGIAAYGEELMNAARLLQERIYSYAGEEFNIGSPKQLGEVLFDKMGLPKSKKNKTGYSTDAEALQKLMGYHPIIADILDYRQVTKLKATYADGLVKAADEQGRIHSIFNQTGTATGRLSSSDPNLQNIPVRTELGKRFRQFFIPKSQDYVLIDADYSQIELRLLAHIAADETMLQAFASKEDIHAMTAAKVFDVPLSQVTSDLRKKAKAVNFGIMYGIGEYSLSEDLNISRAKAREYIDSYFLKFPRIRAYLDQVKEDAKQNGYVTTVFGRRRYIPELSASNKNLRHFGERVAMNSPIQGTAADIMKIAMIRVADELKKSGLDAALILQVHDELLVEAHRDCAEQVKKLLVDCMENAVDFSVSMSVEAQIGNTWLDAKQ